METNTKKNVTTSLKAVKLMDLSDFPLICCSQANT